MEREVSIVVPVWGAYSGEPLAEALESLRAQDIPAQIVVVDNASDTPVVAPEGAKLVRPPRRLTLGAARNLGLEHVETPYVLFWDADDLMLPGTLRVLLDRIAAEPEAVAVAAAIVEGDPARPHRWPRRWAKRLADRPTLFAFTHCIWSLLPTIGSTIMRTSAVRESGGYADAQGGDDWVLGVSLVFRGRVVFVPTPGRLYRRLEASVWEGDRSPRQLMRRARAVRKRIREDPAIPRWAKVLLPVTATMQLLAVFVAQPAAKVARAVRDSPSPATRR